MMISDPLRVVSDGVYGTKYILWCYFAKSANCQLKHAMMQFPLQSLQIYMQPSKP